jgi:hypothetical protein
MASSRPRGAPSLQGVDSRKRMITATKNHASEPHVELVLLFDARNSRYRWTGKSYPTSAQEEGLARISHMKTHFVALDDFRKLMILGCHDLNVYNPRSANAKGWRREVNTRFREIALEEKPICVLYHPHTTVKRRTWLGAWSCLRKTVPSVHLCASAGRYFESDRRQDEYDSLDKVLEANIRRISRFCNTIMKTCNPHKRTYKLSKLSTFQDLIPRHSQKQGCEQDDRRRTIGRDLLLLSKVIKVLLTICIRWRWIKCQ